MNVTTALLADAARVEGGKLYVFGGAWDRIYTVTVPTTHPTLAVVFVLRVEYDEAVKPHRIRLDFVRDGAPAGPSLEGQLGPMGHAPGLKAGAATTVPLAFTAPQLPLEAVGLYEWIIYVDEKMLGSVPMEVEVLQPSGFLPFQPIPPSA